MRCPRFPTRDPLVEFKTSLDKWYTTRFQSAWLYSGEFEKSTISVLPPLVIHTNGLSNTKVLAFCSFLQRNQGTESTKFWFKNSFLNQKWWWRKREKTTTKLLLFFFSQNLSNPTTRISHLLFRKIRILSLGSKEAILSLSLYKEENEIAKWK